MLPYGVLVMYDKIFVGPFAFNNTFKVGIAALVGGDLYAHCDFSWTINLKKAKILGTVLFIEQLSACSRSV